MLEWRVQEVQHLFMHTVIALTYNVVMELRHLRCFVAVAEERHFGRAAEGLYIAQSAVSQQVKRLEEELGVQLLVRNKRRVSLTDTGRAFFEEARRTLEQAEKAAEVARRASRGQVGQLAVGFFGPATYGVLPNLLGDYRKRFPDVELRLYEWTTAKQVEELRYGNIQVGFVRGPTRDEELIVEHVWREPIVVALPEGHRLADLDTVPPEMLADEPFVMVPRDKEPTSHDKYVSICHLSGFSPRVVQEAHHVHTSVALVASGVGVCFVPASVENLRRPGAVYRPLEDVLVEVETDIVRYRREVSPVLRTFLDAVEELSKVQVSR